MGALWGGRFEKSVGSFTQAFGASLQVDKSMYSQDIKGSLAHARMLCEKGIISKADFDKIEVGLVEIENQIAQGRFQFDINDEDIHMAIEKTLIKDVGVAGARLHTGRSRNDQVATDTRLHAKDLLNELLTQNCALRSVIYAKACDNFDVIMPGYTHLQHAQPVLFSHHMLAYFWMFTRDFIRLVAAFDAADANPLGSAALAGTTYPLDRHMTTELLGFDHPIPNSMDAVSDRDYLLDLEYACSVSMMHLSRLCEEIILWSTTEFGFVTLSDSFATGSSIMPQKKNPDFAELTRGKMGRVVGDLVALLVTMEGMIESMELHVPEMRKSAGKGFTAATDVADYLAKKGMPFRQAHEVVGELVLYCEKHHKGLEDLTLDEFKQANELFEADIVSALDMETIVAARKTYGGTGYEAVKVQMKEAEAALSADKEKIGYDETATPVYKQ